MVMKRVKRFVMLVGCLSVGLAGAQEAARSGRDNFLQQQAYAEMQRVSGQVDVLQNNHEELVERVAKAEAKNAELRGEIEGLRAELAAMRNTMVEMNRTMRGQRDEIVAEFLKKFKQMQASVGGSASASGSGRAGASSGSGRAAAASSSYNGPLAEYQVQNGDTLYVVAKAFGTSVQVIKELNGIKGTVLQIGQVLKVPRQKD